MKSAGSQLRTDISTLGAAIACSHVVVTSPSATAQSVSANFDAVDIAILEWIAAEGRRLQLMYRSDLMLRN
jgi:hypothetical protein